MTHKRNQKLQRSLLVLLAGGCTLVTTANCDPRSGIFNFFRDTDNYDYFYDDGFYYDEVYVYDDCYFFGCF